MCNDYRRTLCRRKGFLSSSYHLEHAWMSGLEDGFERLWLTVKPASQEVATSSL